MLIPAKPSLGNKVICRYPGFTFQTFVYQYESIILSPFLKGFPFQWSKNASHTPSFINIWSQTLPHDFEPFPIQIEAYQDGGPRPSFHTPRLDAPYLYKLLPSHFGGQEKRVRLKKPSVLLALVQILLICVFHFKSFVIVTPRHLILSTFSRTVPSKVYEALILFKCFLVSCIMLHLTSWNLIPHFLAQFPNRSISL